MGFKLKSGNKTSFKSMGSSLNKSAFKAVEGDNDAHVQAYNAEKAAKAKASNEVWSKANEASKEQNSGTSLNDLVAKRKTLEKGSNDYNINQNAINKAMGNSKRHDTTTSSDNKVGGGSKEVKTSDNGKVVTTTSKRANDTKKKVSTATNTSTWDAKTGTGSSGKGIVTVNDKYKADGKTLKRRSTSTANMGTDEKSDDIKGSTSRGKRRTKTRSKDPNTGKVTTTKEFHKGKKAGTSQVKEREVGKIFANKVKGGEEKAADEKTFTTKNKRHSDGTLKVKKRKNVKTDEGITDKVERRSKDGKKTTVKFKTNTDGEKGYERKGKVKYKTDKEGNVSKKHVVREGGKRTVTRS